MTAAGLSREDKKKYQKRRDASDKPDAPTDILVATSAQPTEYVKKALSLLEKDDTIEDQVLHKTITLMGRGKAVSTVVQVAEFLKRRVKGLHQISKVENTKVTDVFEPKEAYAEEKLAVVEVDRTVVGLHVVLSLEALDTAALGYQAPLPEEEVTETGSELKRVLQNPRSGKKEQKKKGGSGGARGGAKSSGGRGGGGGGRGAGMGRGGKTEGGRGGGRGSTGRGGGGGGGGGSRRGRK